MKSNAALSVVAFCVLASPRFTNSLNAVDLFREIANPATGNPLA